MCGEIDGFPRHLGIHVGGMLVTRTPLIDLVPIERATMPNRVVTQYDKEDVEQLGLVKIDLLSLRTLGVVCDALDRIQRDTGRRIDLDSLPHDDPEVYASIQAADTVGMFQIESRAQMQSLPKARPSASRTSSSRSRSSVPARYRATPSTRISDGAPARNRSSTRTRASSRS